MRSRDDKIVDIPVYANGVRSGQAKHILNDIVSGNRSMESTVSAIVLYPVLKWALYGEDIQDLMGVATTDKDEMLKETRETLESVFGIRKQLELQHREEFFSTCHTMVELLEDITSDLCEGHCANVPNTSVEMGKSLKVAMGMVEDDGDVPSRYFMSMALPDAVQWIHLHYGKTLDSLVDRLLNPFMEVIETEEERFLYHNVKVLMREFQHLYWMTNTKNDAVIRLIHSRSADEIQKITENEHLLYSADTVLQFVLLISGAIAYLECFPVNGHKYAEIMRFAISKRDSVLPNGEVTFLSQQEVAKAVDLTPAHFSKLKNEAMVLLSLLLWGYDGKSLRKLLKK